MPHIVVEHSKNLSTQVENSKLMQLCYDKLLETGEFSANAIKARSIGFENYYLPDNYENFIHITISILEGRSAEIRSNLSNNVFNLVKEIIPSVNSLSVNIHEMNKTTYSK